LDAGSLGSAYFGVVAVGSDPYSFPPEVWTFTLLVSVNRRLSRRERKTRKVVRLSQQLTRVERFGLEYGVAPGVERLLLRPVVVEFDAVAVGVGEVHRDRRASRRRSSATSTGPTGPSTNR
jgi:hypothetical protein